jgi:transposase
MAVRRPEPAGRRGRGAGRVAVGIDPSRAALQIATLSPHGDQRREHRVALSPAAVMDLVDLLGSPGALIAMEGSHSIGQLFLLELLARGYDVREIQPFVSKRFRQALSEDHTDRKDAGGLALLARWKPDLPPVRFSEAQATCKRLARLRTQLVQDRTRYANRLHAALSETYGAVYKELFGVLLTKKALRFFGQYPTLNDALAGGPAVAVQVGEPAWARLQQVGRWREGLYLGSLRAEVRALAAHLLALKDRIAELERELTRLPASPDLALLRTLPGLGTSTALTIVGNTGDVQRFGSVHHYVAYCGLAPARHQSGAGEATGKPRQRYNRRLKQAFLFLAFNRLQRDPRARAYYDRKRAGGKEHWPALRCLARYFCRIVFHLLTQHRPYSPVLNMPT